VSTSSSFSSYVGGYQNLDVGSVMSHSVSGLNANKTYYYRVRAYNAEGTSANSNTRNVATLPNPPSAPTANPASGVTSSGFTANWSSTSGATGYRLDVSTSSSFSSYVSGYQDLDVGNVTSRDVSGLSANTPYYYRVRANNTGGTSENSGTISVTTTSVPNNPPDPPSNVSPANGAVGQPLTVSLQSGSFSDPDGDTHAASQWQLFDSTGTNVIWDSGEDSANKTSHSVPSGQLNYLTIYRWQVRNKDNRGAWSAYSTSTSFTTVAETNSAPAYNPANGHYYEVVQTTGDWLWAKVQAESRYYLGMRGHLATIADAAEGSFVFALVDPNPGSTAFWLGGFQSEGTAEPFEGWQWVTGEPWTYSSWQTDEPNDLHGEDCLAVSADSGGPWNDLTGKGERDDGTDFRYQCGFVVEYDDLFATLSIAVSNLTVVVSWPAGVVGFTLESSTDVGPAAAWASNLPPPVVSGTDYVVTNQISDERKFYRLKK